MKLSIIAELFYFILIYLLKFIYENWLESIIFLLIIYAIVDSICKCIVNVARAKYSTKQAKPEYIPTLTRNAPTGRPRPEAGPTPPKAPTINIEKTL